MKRVSSFWNREPVAFLTIIQAGIGLAAAFGLQLSGEQMGAIMAFSAAVIGFITRQNVSPNTRAIREGVLADVNRKYDRLGVVVLACLLGASACASAQGGRIRHGLTEVDKAAYIAVAAIQDSARAMRCSPTVPPPCLTDEQFKQVSAGLVPVLDAGEKFSAALLAWKPDRGLSSMTPAELWSLGVALNDLRPIIQRVVPAALQGRLLDLVGNAQRGALGTVIGK